MTEKWKRSLAALGAAALLTSFAPGQIVMAEQMEEICLGGAVYPQDSTELTLSGLSAEEVEAVLPLFPKLQKLILTDTDGNDEALDRLNRAYPEIDIVWTVQVGKIKVRTDETWFYTAGKGYLPNNEDLKKLRYCTQMIAVDVGHLNVTDCSWLEYMPHLKYLILADTKITDISPVANLKELLYLELFNLNLKDYSPLLGCTCLQDLNISSTHADPTPLSQMTWLHNLHWYQGLNDPATRQAVQLLPQQLPQTNVMLDMVGVISNPWRSLPHYYVFRDIIGGEFLNQSFIIQNWGSEDSSKILACDRKEPFAGEVLAEIVKYRMDNGLPIVGAKDAQRAQVLYESLCESHP